MAQRNGLISLLSFLHKYFFKQGVDEGEIHRYYAIAADGLRDLHIHHFPIVQTTTLTVDGTNYTADYPDDYIDYVLLAVERDGRWWTFTRDDNMVDKTIAGITGANLSSRVSVAGPGSVGGHNSFYFQPDNYNRRFLFDGSYSSSVVVLKYQSSGVEVMDVDSFETPNQVEFPIYAEDAMEKYLRWQIAEWDDAPDNVCKRREKQYTDAVRMLRNLNSLSVSEIRDIWASSSNVTGVIRS